MRALNSVDIQQVSGGVLCVDGYCVVVPNIGVSAQYYNTIDNAYNLWLNDKINYDQLDFMLINVPWAVEKQYLDNLSKVLS